MSTFDPSIALSTIGAADFMGAAGVVLGSTWALFRNRRTILSCQALGSLAFCTHYILLGSPTAAIACAMSVTQSIAGYSGRRPSWLGPLYLATWLVVACGALATWHGLPSLLVVLASGFATLGRWQLNLQRMRLVFLLCSSCWVSHNLLVGSTFGLISDSIALTSLTIGLWRNRRRPLQEAVRALLPGIRSAIGRAAFRPTRTAGA